MKNPTLVMPVKSKKQLGHLFKAQGELAKAGVTFDSGTRVIKPMQRHWELDWSLKGAKVRNPEYNAIGRKIVKDDAVVTVRRIKSAIAAHGKVITKHSDEFYTPAHLTRIRESIKKLSIPYSQTFARVSDGEIITRIGKRSYSLRNPRLLKRNPSKRSEKGGVLTGFSLMLLFPIIMGLVFWFESRKKE